VLVAAVVGGLGLAATVVLGRRPGSTEAADDADGDPLQAALDAVPSGGEYVIDRAWTRSRSLVVRRPLRLRFTGTGALRMTTGSSALLVQVSDVEVVDAVITGAGADSGGLGHGIAVMGLRGAPLHGIAVRRGHFRDIPHDGVHLEYCDRFEITGTTMERLGYAGIVGVGVVDGTIDSNTVRDVRQPARRVNSYGISLTRDARYAPAEARRSARVRVTGNRVDGVPAWEGIDTHAGEDIEIRGNVVTGCRVGIAAVPSKDPADREQTSVAPIGLVIADNTVTRSPGLAPGSAIIVTRGMVVARNRIEASVDNAVCLAHSNASVAVRGNRIVGVGGTGIGVNVRAGANHGVITRNHFESAPHALAVAVRFGDADNRFAVLRNTWGTARVRIAHGGATVTTG